MDLAFFFLQPEGGGGGAAPRAPSGGGGFLGGSAQSLGMLALMFVVFYFMLIRPQQKRAKEHQTMLGGLKKGDSVMTTGGLLGRISGIEEKIVTLEVAEKVRVRVLRSAIQGTHGANETASSDKKD
jgi:preprotein translocase subunit YajC